jgi:hypothetical protein
MYELTPEEFLNLFYVKLGKKLERVIELTQITKRTLDETKELYETKSKLLEAINILVMATNDNDLSEAYIGLMKMIGSKEINVLESAREYCITTRAT